MPDSHYCPDIRVRPFTSSTSIELCLNQFNPLHLLTVRLSGRLNAHRMVGTPEWKAANNRVIPRADNSMSQGVSFQSPLVFTPAGKTLTTAEKQAQTPLYNPLYDPSSLSIKRILVNISQPQQPSPLIQNPLVQPPNAPVATPQIPQLQPQPQGPVAPRSSNSARLLCRSNSSRTTTCVQVRRTVQSGNQNARTFRNRARFWWW